MFEKDAEEWFEKLKQAKVPYTNENVNKYLHKAFKDGAEFGYNKAKKDADKMKSQFLELCNLKDMRIAELEKSNEWNYVKGGIFPKDEKDILCQINFETYEVGYYHQEKRCFYTIDGREIDVIAWKEIVLPKEKNK